MEAFGFQTITVEDGNNLEEIGKAIEAAKADTERPSFITVKTQIGFGCPAKQGKASAHGEPLGDDNIKAMKENLGWESMEPFYVPQDVYDHMAKVKESLKAPEEDWNARFAAYCEKYPEMKELWISIMTKAFLRNFGITKNSGPMRTSLRLPEICPESC